MDALDGLRRGSGDLDARGGVAGERDHVDVGMRDQAQTDVLPGPVTTLSTPLGKMSAANSASASAVRGVADAGLSTTVLPAASAGPSFQIAIISG